MVSWNEAAEFCAALNRQNPALGTAYRLPTEAEWEFAGRAGTTTNFWSGDSDADLSSNAWIESTSSGRPHPVGELNANPFGLHDMHGNVFEWVQNGWEESYFAKFRKTPAVDPIGPAPSEMKVIHGGDWNDPGFGCYISSRDAYPPDFRLDTFGFRVCLEVEAVKAGMASAKVEGGK